MGSIGAVGTAESVQVPSWDEGIHRGVEREVLPVAHELPTNCMAFGFRLPQAHQDSLVC